MVVNMAMDAGAEKNPKKPTNRIVGVGNTSGVRVVNMSADSIRRYSELSELRRSSAKYKNDLDAALRALSMANDEITRLKSSGVYDESEVKKLIDSNSWLKSELDRYKGIETLLKNEIIEITRSRDDLKAEADRLSSVENSLREEISRLNTELMNQKNEKFQEGGRRRRKHRIVESQSEQSVPTQQDLPDQTV
jgi:chromosome segregation ATPase